MRPARLVALALLFAPIVPAQAQEKFALKDGDRVVFYGDSITDQRLYTTYVETFAVTRFPGANLTFVHSGWGGDRVTGGGGGPVDVRLDRDVTAYRPTVVTIMLGMNDGSYQPFRDPIFKTYADGYRHIVDKLKADNPAVRLTLIQPSPYDDVTRQPKFEDGYNSVLLRYGDFVRDLAAKTGSMTADLNNPVVEVTKKAFASDPEGAVNLNKDRVHPGPGGQLLMAEALLKAWNAPSTVADVAIDAKEAKAIRSENSQISGLGRDGDTLHWDQADGSLPFPIDLKDPAVDLAIRSSDFLSALDRQVLAVANLEAAESTLSIDGEVVGTFTKAQLADGVNLATLPTPMAKQAARVHGLTLRHNNLHYLRWRTVQVPNADLKATPAMAQALEGLDGLEAEIVARQRAEAQPKPHRFELKPKS